MNQEKSKRRVVVTGLGAVTPLGPDTQSSWEAAIAGRSGIRPVTRFDASNHVTRIAGQVDGIEPEEYISRKYLKKLDRFQIYAIMASLMALEDSGLRIDRENEHKIGVIIGSGIGGIESIEANHRVLLERGPKKVSPFLVPMAIINLAPGHISILTGAKGPNTAVVTACAAGSHAIGDSFKIIQRGDADAMIAGGVEAPITPLVMAAFNSMRALSTRNDEPAKASRPFDKNRDGFVLAEGCGVLILEELEFARRRGARIYCEMAGYGMSADGHHIVAPAPEGEGYARCMEQALKDAGLGIEDIDYINAHGTSTPLNDIGETQAIKKVFKDRAYEIPVSSTKSMTGHALGGAGGIESVFTILAITNSIIPPTINLEEPDPDCDLDYVPNRARKKNIRAAMSNSFGFGGTNACLVFKRWTGDDRAER